MLLGKEMTGAGFFGGVGGPHSRTCLLGLSVLCCPCSDAQASPSLISSFCPRGEVPGESVLLAHWSHAHPVACEGPWLTGTQRHLTKGGEKLSQRRWGYCV